MANLFDEARPDMSAILAEATDEERMRALIETLSAYITYFHGGAVEMVSFDGRALQVRMSGARKGYSLAPAPSTVGSKVPLDPSFPI